MRKIQWAVVLCAGTVSVHAPAEAAYAYLHTRTHRELFHLLDRAGVFAGNSAGASIQGSYLYGGAEHE
ncbi:MAG: hypothetical protein WDN28_09955 [Chthoniobacter sp.]